MSRSSSPKDATSSASRPECGITAAVTKIVVSRVDGSGVLGSVVAASRATPAATSDNAAFRNP